MRSAFWYYTFTLMDNEETKNLENTEESLNALFEAQLKEALHWFGKKRLLEIIDEIEENEAEAAFSRRNNDY